MAITYDLELDEIGVGVTTYTGIATTTYALSGLTAETNYQVRVREVNTIGGADAPSLWSSWAPFTTTVQQTAVTAQIGAISNSQTLHPVTVNIFVPEVVVTTYDLELTETGQSPTTTTGISTTTYQLTGLTNGTEYTVRVRQVKNVDGADHPSLWSTGVTFTAGVALPDPVVSLIGSLTNTQTIHALTTSITVPVDVVSQIGTVSNSQTLHPITADVQLPEGEVPADYWIVELIDLEDSSTLASEIVTVSNYSATGLSANIIGDNRYRFVITGISNSGVKSTPLNVDFSTYLASITTSTTPTASGEQAIDQFYVSANALYDEFEDFVVVFGEASEAFNTLTGTLDSAPITLNVSGLQFTSDQQATDPSGATQPSPTYPADVEISGTDWTGASTAASTDSVTRAFSDATTTTYMSNYTGKPSYTHASGTLAANYTHEWNNGEIYIPDNASKVDIAGAMRCWEDFTLTLVKNGDYGNPVATATSTPVDDNGDTRYQCNLSVADLVVAGGDRFELSINPITLSQVTIMRDPSLSYFTLTVTEVYV